MTMLRWRSNLSLGVADIDADHKALIEILNRLFYMVKAGDERTEIADVLHELGAYCDRHFRREEALMRRSGYGGLERHARLHDVLRRQVATWTAVYLDDPDAFDITGFYDFVSDWLLVHVLTEDMRLRPYLAEATAAASR
jgi:hemerythrin